MDCEHKFVHLDTNKKWESTGGYGQYYYKRIDTFFCEKCLEYKDKLKETYSRERPDWFGD